MSDNAIKLEGVSKYYKMYTNPKDRLKEALNPFGKKYHKKFYALKQLDLEIKKGEILGIVGRNGAGKSTLLKLISRVIQPSTGNLWVNGAVSAMLELGSGLNPSFTGMQNIYFSGAMQGMTNREIKEKVDEIVAFADIGEFIHQPMKSYSSGMKSRLGFALAINMDPKILILDEVLAVGDDLFRRKCYAKMDAFFKSGCTVIYVSHSMSSINEICSRAILVDGGEILLDGEPKFVTMHYRKLMNAAPGTQDDVRDEIVRLKQSEAPSLHPSPENENGSSDCNITTTDTEPTGTPSASGIADIHPPEQEEPKKEPKEEPKEEARQDARTDTDVKPKAFFIENFTPQSTVVHKNADVDIADIHIKTPEGEKVNCLITNDEYIYSFEVRSKIDVEEINFGMGIRSEKGVPLSWMMHPGVNRYLKNQVSRGTVHVVEWRFKCLFLQGVYYCSAGVRGVVDGEMMVLNKIDDALVFKVENHANKQIGGIFDCQQEIRIERIN